MKLGIIGAGRIGRLVSETLKEIPELELYAIGGPCEAKCLASHVHSSVGYCGPDMEKLKWIKSKNKP